MKALLPIVYLGNVDYYSVWAQADEILLEKFESYPKQTFRNRTTILGANGVMDLTIPIKKGDERLITDIKIDNSVNWRNQHWQALLSGYKSSPFFEYFEADLIQFYESKGEWLFEELYQLHSQLLKLLSIKNTSSFTTEFYKETEGIDLRNRLKPSKDPQLFVQPEYYQVFSDKHGFSPNLGVIDLLSNEGKGASNYLKSIKMEFQ